MPSFQQVMLLGHMGKAPEVKHTTSGMAIANISIATTYAAKNKQTGETTKDTEWHNVTFFGKQAEYMVKYAFKGALCFVQGRIKTEKWTDQSGVERQTKKIMGDKFELLSQSTGATNQTQPQGQPQAPSQDQTRHQPQAQMPYDTNADDIPF